MLTSYMFSDLKGDKNRPIAQLYQRSPAYLNSPQISGDHVTPRPEEYFLSIFGHAQLI